MRKLLLLLPIIILFLGCYPSKDIYNDDCLPIDYAYDSQNLPVY